MVDVLDGINYFVESVVNDIDREMAETDHPDANVARGVRSGHQARDILGHSGPYSAAGSLIHLDVKSVSYNSPFDLVLALNTLAIAAVSATFIANRVIKVYRKLNEANEVRYRARVQNARSRIVEAQARVYEEVADIIVRELSMKPIQTDPRRLRNMIKAIGAIEQIEIED